MIGGIKTKPDGEFCAYCDARISSKYYDFCTKCGNALTSKAIKLREQQIKRIKLEVLDELALEIEDTAALNIIVNKVKTL